MESPKCCVLTKNSAYLLAPEVDLRAKIIKKIKMLCFDEKNRACLRAPEVDLRAKIMKNQNVLF